MAKSKAALETEHRLYRGTICKLQRASDDGDYIRALAHAVSSWDHIDGMIQYESRFLDRAEFASIDSIDFVLQNAPFVFDAKSLKALEALLKSARRVERSTVSDVASDLCKAGELLKHTHRLWNFIESGMVTTDDLKSSFDGDDADFHKSLRVWREIGLIDEIVDGDKTCVKVRAFGVDDVRAKCPQCGISGSGPLSQYLDEQTCPLCEAKVDFVILPQTSNVI